MYLEAQVRIVTMIVVTSDQDLPIGVIEKMKTLCIICFRGHIPSAFMYILSQTEVVLQARLITHK